MGKTPEKRIADYKEICEMLRDEPLAMKYELLYHIIFSITVKDEPFGFDELKKLIEEKTKK